MILRFGGGGGGRYQQEELGPSPSHFLRAENTALWVFYHAASTVIRWTRKMSEKRGEVIVPAGRHELLPAAKGLNF